MKTNSEKSTSRVNCITKLVSIRDFAKTAKETTKKTVS